MRGPLRPPSTFPMDPTPVFPSYTRKLSQFTLLNCFFFFMAKMAWNAIVCETTDVSRENSIFPIFQKTWFQAILAKKKRKKNEKNVSFTENEDLWNAQIFDSMCTSTAVECDGVAGVRRICGMRRIPSMRGWYRDHIRKFRGQNQNSNPKASPNFQGHTVGSIFPSSPWVRPRGRNLLIFYSANL